MPGEVLMVSCRLVTAVIDKVTRLCDLGPSDGQGLQLIWFLTAALAPTGRMKPHSVGGGWNENSLLNLLQDVPILVQLEDRDY